MPNDATARNILECLSDLKNYPEEALAPYQEFEAEGERYRLGPGDFFGIRPGVLHSLHNPGPGMMRILTLVSPGRQHVRFFSTLGEATDDPSNPPQPSGPPDFEDFERLAAVGRECGIEFLPPPEPNDREQA